MQMSQSPKNRLCQSQLEVAGRTSPLPVRTPVRIPLVGIFAVVIQISVTQQILEIKAVRQDQYRALIFRGFENEIRVPDARKKFSQLPESNA